MNFKGFEELKEMNKGELLDLLKDCVCPHRVCGFIRQDIETKIVQRRTKNGWVDYKLTSYFAKEIGGTKMSEFRPVIGDTEYTWGELNRHPADLLRVMVYQYLRQTLGEEE